MKIEINEHFKKALDLLNNSKQNVFITGKAGSVNSEIVVLLQNICIFKVKEVIYE